MNTRYMQGIENEPHKIRRQLDRIEFKLNALLREQFGATSCKQTYDALMEFDESIDLFQDDPFERLVH